jgi:hypothetical protein
MKKYYYITFDGYRTPAGVKMTGFLGVDESKKFLLAAIPLMFIDKAEAGALAEAFTKMHHGKTSVHAADFNLS